MSDTFDHEFEAYTEYDGPDFNIDTREEANEAAYINPQSKKGTYHDRKRITQTVQRSTSH